MNGLKLCLALAGIAGVAAFAEYEEQGPVYDQWSLFTEQAGKWRGVWTLLGGDFTPLPDQTADEPGRRARRLRLHRTLDGNIRIAVPADWAAGEVGTVALEWAPQGGSQRLVAYVEASYDSAPPPFGSVNIVKFEVQTGNGP